MHEWSFIVGQATPPAGPKLPQTPEDFFAGGSLAGVITVTSLLAGLLGWLLFRHLPMVNREVVQTRKDKDALVNSMTTRYEELLKAADVNQRERDARWESALRDQAVLHKEVVKEITTKFEAALNKVADTAGRLDQERRVDFKEYVNRLADVTKDLREQVLRMQTEWPARRSSQG